jgi:hypothetical protein
LLAKVKIGRDRPTLRPMCSIGILGM